MWKENTVSHSRGLTDGANGEGEGRELGVRAFQASPKSCDLGAGEKAYVLHLPEQFLRATTVPRNVLGPEQALFISARQGQGEEKRQKNRDTVVSI